MEEKEIIKNDIENNYITVTEDLIKNEIINAYNYYSSNFELDRYLIIIKYIKILIRFYRK